jgi:hypothetical protein
LADRFYIVVGAPEELLAAGEAPSVVVTKTLPDDTEQEVYTTYQHTRQHSIKLVGYGYKLCIIDVKWQCALAVL